MQKANCMLRWLSAAAAITLAVLLCWQCIDIWLAGSSADNIDASGIYINPVYSIETVQEHWNRIAVPAWICIGVMAAAIAASLVIPSAKEKLRPDAEHMRMMLVSRIAPEDYPQAAMDERTRRAKLTRMTAMPAMLALFPAMLHLYDRSNYTSWDLEKVLSGMMLLLAPGTLLFTALMALSWRLSENSFRRENELLRTVKKGEQVRWWSEQSRFPVTAVRIGLLLAGIACIIDGVMGGGMQDVLVKAINICTECIGLG